MGEFIADLNNSSLWSLAYQEYKEQPDIYKEGGYIQMPPFDIPILFSSRLLTVKTICNIPPKRKWRFAGNFRAYQTIKGEKTEILRNPLYLNSTKLIELPSFASSYSIVISDAGWLRNLQIIIYEFTGEVKDAITQINTKVDELAVLIGQ